MRHKHKNSSGLPPRIGIFAGTFNPVHSGHIALALQALQLAGLDEVVFLPERRPRSKPGVEHYAHRVAMIKRAIQPHPKFSVLELVDRNFSVSRTLPQLRLLFKGAQLTLIVGSDVVPGIIHWPYARRILETTELIIGVRADHTIEEMQLAVEAWPVQPRDVMLVDSYAADVSSSQIRKNLQLGEPSKGLLASVKNYARREWLYVAPGVLARRMTSETS